jgi:hypothetical protein
VAAIDRYLPEWDVHEAHHVDLPCPPERALEVVLHVPAAPDAWIRLLFRLRGLEGAVPTIGEALAGMGFTVLARSSTEIVAGIAGTPWTRRGGLRAFDEAGPGTVRMAIDFRAEPLASGCRLSTETRVQAVDALARRRFRRYWLVVRPISAIVRRRWLAAVRRSLAA